MVRLIDDAAALNDDLPLIASLPQQSALLGSILMNLELCAGFRMDFALNFHQRSAVS
jgi:hypothetical protein